MISEVFDIPLLQLDVSSEVLSFVMLTLNYNWYVIFI